MTNPATQVLASASALDPELQRQAWRVGFGLRFRFRVRPRQRCHHYRQRGGAQTGRSACVCEERLAHGSDCMRSSMDL